MGWQRGPRASFPMIAADPDVAYLDSAATSPKPQAVLDAVITYLTTVRLAGGDHPSPRRGNARRLILPAADSAQR
ncbi:hypothetical protein QLQ12_28500 [Actinoplanes sp. NEAU-A12]|uniref:Aminotransferase class V domain-containing protein n=1 Tax=Actinoplanes sandaracinus TaxID=3045177 RepID=A0ABT6WS90_9ACTN|nr:hypothetical protein [Actinoplanes sandaracinus]MDI6102568.1 hypothetical protein [Actinoplanes sandaracinus]